MSFNKSHFISKAAMECSFLSRNGSGCPPLFDQISCWPGGLPDSLVIIPCFSEFRGIKYDVGRNASRLCRSNSTWASKANYSECVPLAEPPSREFFLEPEYSDVTHGIYFIGYSVSLIVLLVSFIIFVSFKEMRCLRNKIHTNLFFTYIMANFFWILTSSFQMALSPDSGPALIWCASLVFLRYFHLSTFFWMFVEGLYLFVQVIATFSVESSTFKLRHYLLIGWGLPFVIIVLWSGLLLGSSVTPQAAPGGSSPSSGISSQVPPPPSSSLGCPFINKNSFEWIYTGPVILVLLLNAFFLVWIMWVVITKLRSPPASTCSSAEESNHQHWKATKALLVIIPLLGITYIITIYAPSDESRLSQVLQHLRAFLLSTQGFAVTLPYCFLNTEVRGIIKSNWERWRMIRSLRSNPGNRNSITLATFYTCESRKNSMFRCV